MDFLDILDGFDPEEAVNLQERIFCRDVYEVNAGGGTPLVLKVEDPWN